MVLRIQPHVEEDLMDKVEEKELVTLTGGAISGALINSFTNLVKIILEVGRSIGSSLRRMQDGSICNL